jgi:hypothetical protein
MVFKREFNKNFSMDNAHFDTHLQVTEFLHMDMLHYVTFQFM